VFSTNNTTFPASPVNGQTVLVNGVLWCYSTIEGSAAWNPLTNQKNSYVHTQAVASFQWTVVHNLGNENLVYGVYDSDGNLTIANIHFINNSSFTLNFTSATAGRVVVFADAQRHAQSLSATAFTADSVSIASGVVTADNTGVHINGFPVPVLVGGLIPAAQIPTLQWPNINGTPTTVSGYGITDAYTKAQTSALIATNAVGSTTQNFAANTISVAGNILPTGTGQTIGSPVARFSAIYVNEAYLAASTLYIDGTPVMKTTAENVHITADLNQGILIQTTGTGHLTLDSAAGTTIQTSAQNADCVVQATGLGSLARITSATEVKLTAPVVTLLGAVGITGDTTITGNFIVTGIIVTVNSTNVIIKDNIIVLNKGEIVAVSLLVYQVLK